MAGHGYSARWKVSTASPAAMIIAAMLRVLSSCQTVAKSVVKGKSRPPKYATAFGMTPKKPAISPNMPYPRQYCPSWGTLASQPATATMAADTSR